MSNGVNGLFVFVEQGTDPRLGDGFDAPINSLCTFSGVFLQKTGDDPTAWAEFGGGFSGGTVPDETTFENDVEIQGNLSVGAPSSFSNTVTFEADVTMNEDLTVGGACEAVAVRGSSSVTTPELVVDGGGTMILFGAGGAGQSAAIPDAAGGATVDAEARTALNALLAYLRLRGDVAI
jgi:hypothetical protein